MTLAAPLAPARTKQLVLLACIAGSSVAFLDEFVVNVALPAIRADLGGGLAGQQWVTNAYLLALSSLLLVGGSLGDVFGERRAFSIGVAAFGVTSLLCALAPSIEVLIAGRALQGAAGALLVPSTLAVIVATFSASERGGAIGTWTAWTGVATVVGPLVGGALVDAASWRLVFAVNVPLVVATLVLAAVAIPPPAADRPRPRVDAVGGLLASLALGGPVFALIEQPNLGWGSPLVAGPLAGGVILLVAFVAWERRAPSPMLPLGLFAHRGFSVGNLQTLTFYAGLAALFFFLTIFLQQVVGYAPLQAGAASLPTTAVLFVLAKRFGTLADRYGPRAFMTAGPLLSAVGMLLLLRIDERLDYVTDLLPALLIFAVGLAMTVAPLTAAVLASVEERHAGIASGVNNAVSSIAGLLAIAVIGLLVAGRFGAAIEDAGERPDLSASARAALAEVEERPLARPALAGVPAGDREVVSGAVADASVEAFHVAMGAGGALIALGGVIAGVGMRAPRRAVRAEDCPGGALAGHPSDEAGCRPASETTTREERDDAQQRWERNGGSGGGLRGEPHDGPGDEPVLRGPERAVEAPGGGAGARRGARADRPDAR